MYLHYRFACLNPFLVRVGVGTKDYSAYLYRENGLNPFLVRVGVGTLIGDTEMNITLS